MPSLNMPYPYERTHSVGEDPAEYHQGGLHPIYLGDVLDDRYKICRKLGFGGTSTVWLAKDFR